MAESIKSVYALRETTILISRFNDLLNKTQGTFNWLDLGCGNGEVVNHLNHVGSPENRNRVCYTGVDVNSTGFSSIREYAVTANLRQVNLLNENVYTSLNDVIEYGPFNLITIINLIHELDPLKIFGLITKAITLLNDNGLLFIFDCETIKSPELNSIPWEASEFSSLIGMIFKYFAGCNPADWIASYTLSSTIAWELSFSRNYINIPNEDLITLFTRSKNEARELVFEILNSKKGTCHDNLVALSRSVAETGKESQEAPHALHVFWAVSHYLEDHNENTYH